MYRTERAGEYAMRSLDANGKPLPDTKKALPGANEWVLQEMMRQREKSSFLSILSMTLRARSLKVVRMGPRAIHAHRRNQGEP
jgi:hypothetical protein